MTAERRRRLSAGQERLWFLQQFNGATGLYNEHVCARVSGALNLPALCQAFAEIRRWHESLRWTIHDEGGSCYAIARDAPCSAWLRTIDLEAVVPNQRERTYRSCATAAARRPFDLTNGPLWRVWLFRFSSDQFAIAVTTHHIISDAWSLEVLVEDLCRAYRTIVGGTPGAADVVDYGDERATRGECGEHVPYWTGRLAHAPPPVSLPTLRQRPSRRTFAGAKEYFALDDATTAMLRARVREERITPFIMLLGLWTAYLGASAGSRDVVVGTTTAGRSQPGTARRIGFFVNTLAIRTEVRLADSFRRYLRQVRAVSLEALDHQTTPFEHVVRALRLPREPNRHPLFEVMFIYVNTAVRELALPEVTVRLTPQDIALGLSKFDLVISFCELGTATQGLIDYSLELYDPVEMHAQVTSFQRFAARALDDPDRPIGALMPMDGLPTAVVDDLRFGL